MEIEHHLPAQQNTNTNTNINITSSCNSKPTSLKLLFLLLLNILLIIIGASGSPLILRVYFLHGGDRKWFSSFLQTAAFPLLLLPLLVSFLRSPRRRRFLSISPFLLFSSIFIGLITGIHNLLYTYGISYLPVSTASLLISTNLGFTAVFAFFLVKQKFTASSVNAVVLLTFSSVVVSVHSNGDKPQGESTAKYDVGFIMTLAAAVLSGLMAPLVELMYTKSKMDITYILVIEIQFVIGFAATTVSAVGMIINKDFQVMSTVSFVQVSNHCC